jgi:hypothetical protein
MSCLLAGLAVRVALAASCPQEPPPELIAVAYPDGIEAALPPIAAPSLACLVVGPLVAGLSLPGGAPLAVMPQAVGGVVVLGPGVATQRLGVGSSAAMAPGAACGVQAVLLDVATGRLSTSQAQRLCMPAVADEADLVLLFGQSNGEGAVPIGELPPALRREQPFTRIWNDQSRRWEALLAGHNGSSYVAAPWCGPEMGIAMAAEAQRRPVWLLKLAIGPSSLVPTPGPWSEWNAPAGELYAELLRRVDEAAAAVRALGLVPRLRTVCMMQGESDALDLALAADYQIHLRTLVRQLRKDLGDHGVAAAAAAPFQVVLVDRRLARVGFRAVGFVREAQQCVMAAEPDCHALDPSSLPLRADGIHFALPAVLALGSAFLRNARE